MGQHSGIFIILKGGCFKSVPAEFYKTPCQLLNVILWRNMKHPLHLAAGVMFLKMKDLPVITQIFGCLQTLLESLSSVKVLIIDPFMMYTAAGLSKHLQYVIHVCWLLIKGVEKWYRLFCNSDTSQFRLKCVTTLLAVKNTQVFTWLFTLTPIYESICVGHSFRKSNTSTKAAGPPSSFFDVIRSSYRANFWLVYKQTWWPEIEIFGQTLVLLLLLLQNISHHCWH